MKKRRIILSLLWSVILAALIALLWPREKEPVFRGRTLSQWMLLNDLSTGAESVHNSRYNPAALRESDDAIHQIGTNALPWLIKWIQCERSYSRWRMKLWKAIDKLPGGLSDSSFVDWLVQDPMQARDKATIGFRLLGTNASAAVPELTRLINDGKSARISDCALYALVEVGPNGLTPVMAILTNPKDPNRPAAAHVLAPRSDLGTNAGLAVRVLAECVSDPNPEVAIGAAESLGGWLALEPEITVHALAGGLQDPRDKVRLACAKSLAGWGGRARPAVPALTLALHDSNSLVRGWALHALFEVGPDGLTLVMAVLANPKDPNRPVAAGLLSCRSCLGTNAGLAVRLLAECVSDPDPEVATEAADSLGRLALEPEITVPALAGGLEDPRDKVRIACARSLARIGGQARPAVPALTLALHDSNFQVRNWATNIVLKIAPEVLDQMR